MGIDLKEGQVYVYKPWANTNLEVSYQILALWDDWVWTLVYGTYGTMKKDPQSYKTSFFDHENMVLKYDVPLSIAGRAPR